jgi:hypothetical protein
MLVVVVVEFIVPQVLEEQEVKVEEETEEHKNKIIFL